jgi:hypothetical protein
VSIQDPERLAGETSVDTTGADEEDRVRQGAKEGKLGRCWSWKIGY